jgi:hypothetical protein
MTSLEDNLIEFQDELAAETYQPERVANVLRVRSAVRHPFQPLRMPLALDGDLPSRR